MPTTHPLLGDDERSLDPHVLGVELYEYASEVMADFLASSFYVLSDKESRFPLNEPQQTTLIRELLLAVGRLPDLFEEKIAGALEVRAEIRRMREDSA